MTDAEKGTESKRLDGLTIEQWKERADAFALKNTRLVQDKTKLLGEAKKIGNEIESVRNTCQLFAETLHTINALYRSNDAWAKEAQENSE